MSSIAIPCRAVLLGERIDHKGLIRAGAGAADMLRLPAPDGVHAFAFRWGAVAIIGGTPAEQAAILDQIRPFVRGPVDPPAEERVMVAGGAEEDALDTGGLIRLRDLSPARLGLVADALAKSAALTEQEEALAGTLDRMDPVVSALRDRGRLTLSTRVLMRPIGAALAARARATARIRTDDKPDLLWDHPELERLHARLADEFELVERTAALDRKMTLIGEATETLLALVEARRSLGLELAVAVLVAIEVATTLYGLAFGS